jgi:hypothetical protein
MILYVNGDSHAAAAEAVNPYAFAEDDPNLVYLGRIPHPENLAVSWGKSLSQCLKAGFHCGAESASSNARILRTTREWLSQQTAYNQLLLIIQWSTWEREEWPHNGNYLQVGSSGIDQVPPVLEQRYKDFVLNTDWKTKTLQAHEDIWKFHNELNDRGISHVFFNGNSDFSHISQKQDWGSSYIGPYDPAMTYDAVIKQAGIETVAPNSWHFGQDGHSFFYRFMLQYIIANKFI